MYAEDPANRLWIDQIPYAGALIFGAYSGKPIIVNRLNLDLYLEGVLQPEMGRGPTASTSRSKPRRSQRVLMPCATSGSTSMPPGT